ncbi:MAG: hypothetical protein ACI8QZ_000406 [Chlamydiales bacterium]|jgi:uncharacterized protein (DUF58 family)
MSAQPTSILDPTVLEKLSGLTLVARTVVEGFMAGQHTSPHRGSSVEFAQHRPYAPGDELRNIDWRVFARSDRLVVKEYIVETNLSCHLLLDASESMAYGSLAWTKFDYARWCAASLAHLVLTQRDTAGLVVFDEEHRTKVPPANGAPQERAIIETLTSAEPNGPTRIGRALGLLAPRLGQRGIVMIFSDFFDDLDEIQSGIERLAHGGHEPILFQILDPQETAFDFDALLKLEGLESTGNHKIDPKTIRDAYLEEVKKHNDGLAQIARKLSVDCVRVSTADSLDAILSTYLARRMSRARGGRV